MVVALFKKSDSYQGFASAMPLRDIQNQAASATAQAAAKAQLFFFAESARLKAVP